MTAEAYADFLGSIGHRVVRSRSGWWFNVRPGLYMGFPYHRPLDADPAEVEAVLGTRGLIARFSCPVEKGRASYTTVCDREDYNMGSLKTKPRNQVRRGLERCSVRRLTFRELERSGAREVSRATMLRQGRPVPSDHDAYWRAYYAAADTCQSMEAWAAFVGKELAAFLIATTIEDCVYILEEFSLKKHLREYPNNALVYRFTSTALARPLVKEVSYGLEPLQKGLAGLDHFKQGMGFINRPIGQRIELNRFLRSFLARPILARVRRIAEGQPRRESLGKLAGILRRYEEQPDLSCATHGRMD